MVRVAGEKPRAVPPEVTCTVAAAGVNPWAEAVMVADPAFIPFTIGARPGEVEPSGIKILAGATLAVDESLLPRLKNAPPDGAGLDNVTGNDVD